MQNQGNGNGSNGSASSSIRTFKGSAARKINKKKVYKEKEYRLTITFSPMARSIGFKLFENKDSLIDEGSKSGTLNDFESFSVGDEVELDNYLFMIDEEIQNAQSNQMLRQQQQQQRQYQIASARSLISNQQDIPNKKQHQQFEIQKGFDYSSTQSQSQDDVSIVNKSIIQKTSIQMHEGMKQNININQDPPSNSTKNDIEKYLLSISQQQQQPSQQQSIKSNVVGNMSSNTSNNGMNRVPTPPPPDATKARERIKILKRVRENDDNEMLAMLR